MGIINDDLHRILDPFIPLTLMGEGMLERIVEDPNQPLLERSEKGYGIEALDTYDTKTSFLDICRQGKAIGARRLDAAYDFFFGGDMRENYPDSPLTVKAYKIIHDLAKEHGMGFGASVVSPLDTGGGYVKTHENKGQTMQFQEGIIREDGSYETVMDFQLQWTNNKGPAKLSMKEVKVFAFDEERIPGTPYYYVNEHEILDISASAQYHIDKESFRTSRDGYGHGDIRISGKTNSKKTRFLAVVVYNTLEIDYFAEDALAYMKSILDLHKQAGITYEGIYSDEMHIQFDWDTREHWAETEVTTRYMTDSMARAYADLFGTQYRDFAKYLVYFTYMHHDFLGGEEGKLPAQHVFGKTRKEIVRTFLFRKQYFDLLHHRVVELCTRTKEYAQELFGHKMQATGHSTWQESPTTDSFKATKAGEEISRYDYTDAFAWSAAQRENISACNDHFRWNDYFWAVGTDIPEGGFLDRNYYGAAFTSGLAVLNPAEFAYYCIWGAPDQVKERLVEVGQTYGHYTGYCKSYEPGHNLLQGCTARISDVLAVCPMDLNYLEERFGNWMVQYGYADYITEGKLLEYAREPDSPLLQVKGRSYRGLVVFFSPLMSAEALSLIHRYVKKGGKVIWCSMPALRMEAAGLWRDIFGIDRLCFDKFGIPAGGGKVHFGGLETVGEMTILTDLFPDHIYPVKAADAAVAAMLAEQVVGTVKEYPGGGKAVYLGFRVRDDQSCSTGEDVNTLFSVLRELGFYEEMGPEASSRPAEQRYLYNRFPNGTISLCNHFRTFREMGWPWGFYRDEEKDDAFMQDVTLPPHNIDLQQAEICGHWITCQCEGIVSYRYDSEAGLQGFAARNTCGICVDGKDYRFTQSPADLVWGKLDGRLLDDDCRSAYLLKCNKAGRLTLPFDATGMELALCENYMLRPVAAYPYKVENGLTVVELDASAAGSWMVFYSNRPGI